KSLLSKIGLTTTLKNAWTTSRQVNFFWVANFNLKFGISFQLCHFPKVHYKIVEILVICGIMKSMQ
ncbi:hypothetical protein Q7V23_09265, partial [Streptococcus suis]|nr:hypothetical protein [Streptococcus suis]MDW8590202.1 hypothetical protein [Streptococcus suis]MDW8616205.1 hypothetical protein [Streptococcus suis]